MSHSVKRLIALGFALVAGVPLLLTLVGIRPTILENRSATPYPVLSASAMLDGATYRTVDDFLADRMPFRDLAIEADARIKLQAFGDNPAPEAVWIGEDDWLFFVGSATRVCRHDVTPEEMAADFALISNMFRITGREFRLVIPPDKISIYPQLLGEAAEERPECEPPRRARLHELLQSGAVPGFVDLWAPLQGAKSRQLYYKGDTHWNPDGALIFVRELVDSLRPGLWDQDAVIRRSYGGRVAGLRNVLGIPEFEPATEIDIERPGLQVTSVEEWRYDPSGRVIKAPPEEAQLAVVSDGGGISFTIPQIGRSFYQRRAVATDGVDVIEGTTVFIQDSFLWDPLEMLPQYFSKSVFTTWGLMGSEQTVNDLRSADTVIVETLERVTYQRVFEGELLRTVVRALWPELPSFVVPFDEGVASRSRDVALSPARGSLTTTSAEGRIELTQVPTADGAARFAVVRLTADEPVRLRWFWADAEGDFDGGGSERFDLEPGAHTIVVDLRDALDSTRHRIRPGAAGVEIHSVRVVDVP